MAQIVLKPAATWESYEAGMYTAEIEKVEVVEHAADTYHETPYEQLRWSFRLHEVEGRNDCPRFGWWTSMSLNSKSKLPKLLDAFAVPYTKDSFDPADAVGRFGRIYISEYIKADKTIGNKASDFSPYKGKPLRSALGDGSGSQQGRIQGSTPKKVEELPESEIPF